MKVRAKSVVGMVLLVLALAAPASAAAQERTVSVSAEATLRVPNDTASVGLAVSRERRSRGAALRAVASGLRGVIAAVQAIPGVGAGDVTSGRITVGKLRRDGGGVVYRAAEGISVTLHQPERAGELVSAAIGAGATGVSGPDYFVGSPEAAAGKVLTVAFEKARARASALAAAAGATLGPALTIEEGNGAEFTPGPTAKSLPANGCAKAAPTAKRAPRRCTAPPPTKPGTSTVTATVHVVFALQ